MNPDPTITVSLDYLVELSDDGAQPEQPDPQVIIIPPASHGTDRAPPLGTVPAPEPKS
jgi:hypothetical protein